MDDGDQLMLCVSGIDACSYFQVDYFQADYFQQWLLFLLHASCQTTWHIKDSALQ